MVFEEGLGTGDLSQYGQNKHPSSENAKWPELEIHSKIVHPQQAMNGWNMLAVLLLAGIVWGLGGCGQNGDTATSAPVAPLPNGHGELEGFAYHYIEHTDHKDPGEQFVISLTDTNGVSIILTTDAGGRFSVILPAGVYGATYSVPWIESKQSLGNVEVIAGATTEALLEIDRMEFYDGE